MEAVALDDLLLAELASSHRGGDGKETPLSELVETFGSSTGRLSDQFELVQSIEQLRERGLVAVDDESGDAETSVRLTNEGDESADEIRERLAKVEITVVDEDGRQEVCLSEAAADFDRSLTGIAAQLTDDGIYYRDDSPSEGLLDRTAECDRCREVIETVDRTKSGRAVFLSGPAGVGKTRLAEAVLEDLPGDATVRTARCRGEGSEPFQPLRDALGDPAPLATFTVTGSEIDDPDRFASRQTALFHDVTEWLAPAEASLSVLFLDDLHLADSETMAYLSYLLDHIDGYSLVLLGAYRPGELSDDAPLARNFARSAAPDAKPAADGSRYEPESTYVSVGPLDRETTRGIVEQTVGHRGAPTAFVEAVHERTGGNPLYVEKTVRALLETDQLDDRYRWYPTDTGDIALPDAVRQTIRQQIEGFGASERELLCWAALVGDRVPLNVLESVCDIPPTRFNLVVETLIGSDIFTWATDDALSFRSDVVRESVVETIDPERRERRHTVIAETMETACDSTGDGSTDDDRAAAIATQFERAGEHDRAITWYTRAGERATDIYAHQAAVDHFDDALGLATAADDIERVLDLSERQAEVMFLLGAYDEAKRRVRFVRERADDDRRLRMTALACRIANTRGDYETAIDEATAGLQVAGGDSLHRGRLLDQKALAERRQSELGRATDTSQRLLEVAKDREDVTLQARAHKHLGVIAWRQSDYNTASRNHSIALDLLDAVEDPSTVATIHNNLGVFSRYQGRYPEAQTHLEKALTTYRDQDDRAKIALASMNLSAVEAKLGNFQLAESYSEDARRAYRAVGDQHGMSMARMGLGRIKRLRGEPDAAMEVIEPILADLSGVDDDRFRGIVTVELGAAALEAGDLETARGRLQEGIDILTAAGDSHEAARARRLLGQLALETGEFSLARDRLREARETFQSVDDRQGAAKADSGLGRVAAHTGDLEEAVDRYHGALDTFRENRAVLDELATLKQLATAARRRGDGETHRRCLARARELLDEVADDALADYREWIAREKARGDG